MTLGLRRTVGNRVWVKAGFVGRPHGLRGGFKLTGRDGPLASSVKTLAFETGSEQAPQWRVSKIVSRNTVGGHEVLHVACTTRREGAEELNRAVVWVPRDEIVQDASSEFVLGDVVGRGVAAADGSALAVIADAYNVAGGTTVIALRRVSDSAELDLPLTADFFDLQSIDHGTRPVRIAAHLPETYFDDLWTTKK